MKEYLLQQFSLVSCPERSVLDAICLLDQKRVFTKVFDALKRDVIPGYNAKHQRITQPSAQEQTQIRRYSEGKQISLALERSFHEALSSWARQFNLTEDLRGGGPCLQWALDFGHACCMGDRRYPEALGSSKQVQQSPPYPLGLLEYLPDPTEESFTAWYERAKPHMRAYYRQIKADSQRRVSGQRNPDRYLWFILSVCGEWSFSKIADELSLPKNRKWTFRPVSDDAVRKGVHTVISELGLDRKVRRKNVSK
jgi:hypothetical protein